MDEKFWMVQGKGVASVRHPSLEAAVSEARRILETDSRGNGGQVYVLEAVAVVRQPRPAIEVITLTSAAVGPRVDVAGIPGFQTLMRVQEALVGLVGVREVTVGSYTRGVGGFNIKGTATREEVIAAVGRAQGQSALTVTFPTTGDEVMAAR